MRLRQAQLSPFMCAPCRDSLRKSPFSVRSQITKTSTDRKKRTGSSVCSMTSMSSTPTSQRHMAVLMLRTDTSALCRKSMTKQRSQETVLDLLQERLLLSRHLPTFLKHERPRCHSPPFSNLLSLLLARRRLLTTRTLHQQTQLHQLRLLSPPILMPRSEPPSLTLTSQPAVTSLLNWQSRLLPPLRSSSELLRLGLEYRRRLEDITSLLPDRKCRHTRPELTSPPGMTCQKDFQPRSRRLDEVLLLRWLLRSLASRIPSDLKLLLRLGLLLLVRELLHLLHQRLAPCQRPRSSLLL